MAKFTKRQKLIQEKLGNSSEVRGVGDAIDLLKACATVKFSESLDVAVNLGVDPRKSDQAVRGSTVLPNGTGKAVKVAVFTQGVNAEKAKAAGADAVGMDELAEEFKSGNFDYDVVIASPDAMRIVGQLGKVLGPRGLMPNPKVGTVTADVETAVKNFKSGQARYRTDKNGIIHCAVGSIAFEKDALIENLTAVIADLRKAKPSSSKGIYMQKVTLSTTMGPGLSVDMSTIG